MKLFSLTHLAAATLAASALMASTSSQAAGLQVSPTMLTFQGNDTSEVLNLYNRSDAASTMQVRIFRWTQDKGEDLLDSASDIIPSPPVQEVGPEGHQVVRLVRTGPAAGTDELAYRVLVDELPPPTTTKTSGVNMLLRFSVPAFVPPTGGGKPVLKATWTQSADGKHELHVSNTGNVHAQIVAPTLVVSGQKDVVLNDGLYGYVLPHQERSWPLATNADPLYHHSGVSLKFLLNGTEVTLPIDAS